MVGWIKLHRSLKDWEWYSDHNATRLLIHLLVSVNYEDKPWKNEIVKAGTMITSWDNLSHETGLSVKQVRTAMSKLEKGREVGRQVGGNGASKWQVITLMKWDKLQDDGQINGQTKGSKSGKQRATTKEVKKQEVKNNTSTSINIDIEVEQQAAKSQKPIRFIKPTISDIEVFTQASNLNLNPDHFFDFYESKDWMVGKNKMKDWKAAARNWARRNSTVPQQTASNNLKTQKQNENQHHNAHALKHLRSLEREGGFSPRTIEIARNYCLNEATTVDVYQLIPKLRELEGRVQDADTRHSGNPLWIGS